MQIIEDRIQALEERNKKVEVDKAWETSWTRRVILLLCTYIAIGLYLWAIHIPRPWINAIVPAIGFMISTFSLPFFKKFWLKYKKQ